MTNSNPTVAQAPLIFSAASYNIHQGVGPDGRRDDRRIVQVLQNLDAGIIGLQEVDSQTGENEIFQLRYLTRETDFKAVAGPTLRRQDSDFGNVLLTRYKILEVRNVDLSVSRREPRGAIDVDLNIGGAIVRVIVTHLGLSGRERRRQTNMLSNLVAERRDTNMVVVLGDLNEWHPYGRSLRSMARHFGKSARLRTFPSWMPLFALDRIWVWPGQALVETKVHRRTPARSASDHLPIQAKITTAYA